MMAMWIGAMMEPGPHAPMVHGPAGPLLNSAFLQVNLLGERFMNEAEMGNATFFGNAVARQKNRCAFVLFDGATGRDYQEHGFYWLSSMMPAMKITDFDAEFNKAVERGNTAIFSGSSLDELAAKTGMDVKTARKYLRSGRLPSQMKVPRYWRTREDPFAEVWPEVEGLIQTTPDLQVLTIFEDLQRRYPGRFQDGQLRTLQRRIRVSDATERNLAFALSEITKIANNLNLPKSILETASVIYRKAVKERLIRGGSIQGVTAAAIYLACRQCGLARTLEEIAQSSSVNKKEVGRSYRF
jgi:hypothetical protein